MAVVIVDSPQEVTPVYNDVEWIVKLTDIGTVGVNSIKMFYRLEDDLGNILVQEEALAFPVANMEVPLNFTFDLRGLVQTMIPKVSQTVAVQDEFFFKKIKLMYGTIETDLVECTFVKSAATATSLVTIINAVQQSYELDLIDYSLPNTLLCHIPTTQTQCRGAFNYIWIWNGNNVELKSNLGNSIIFSNITEAGVYPIRTNLLPTPNNITYLEIYCNEFFITRIYIEDCDCNTDVFGSERNIMFLDPLGGRQNIHFREVESYNMSTDFEIIQKLERDKLPATFTADNNKAYAVGGETMINKASQNSITLIHSIPRDKYNYNTEFYKAFLGGGGYHIQIRDAQGQSNFYKFIIESGTMGYKRTDDEIDLVITGYFSPRYKAQTIDR